MIPIRVDVIHILGLFLPLHIMGLKTFHYNILLLDINNGLVLMWGYHTSLTNSNLNAFVGFPTVLNMVLGFATRRDVLGTYQSNTGTVHFNSMHVDCALVNRITTTGFYFTFMNTGYKSYYIVVGY